MKNQRFDVEWWISGKAQCIRPSMVGLLFPICFTMKSNPFIFIFFRTGRRLQRCVSSSCYIFYWKLPSGSLNALKKSCKYYPVCICAATKGVETLTHKQARVNPIKVTQPLQNLCDSATLKHEHNTYFCVHWCTFQSHSWGNRVCPPLLLWACMLATIINHFYLRTTCFVWKPPEI